MLGRIGFFAAIVCACGLAHAQSIGAPNETTAKSAIFAGGCFWCMEEAFDKVPGVLATTSGYTGGSVVDPTYEQASAGGTGHVEAVKVEFDPAKVSYSQLLGAYWHNVDPFDPVGQFCDKGESYRSVIFTADAGEQALAESSKEQIAARFEHPVATEIRPQLPFYPAEAYHQDFHAKSSLRYRYYKWACGRAQRLEEIWGKAGT